MVMVVMMMVHHVVHHVMMMAHHMAMAVGRGRDGGEGDRQTGGQDEGEGLEHRALQGNMRPGSLQVRRIR